MLSAIPRDAPQYAGVDRAVSISIPSLEGALIAVPWFRLVKAAVRGIDALDAKEYGSFSSYVYLISRFVCCSLSLDLFFVGLASSDTIAGSCRASRLLHPSQNFLIR
jgi:hypothetical protein